MSPAHVRVFTNRDDIDFDNVEKAKVKQTFIQKYDLIFTLSFSHSFVRSFFVFFFFFSLFKIGILQRTQKESSNTPQSWSSFPMSKM